MHATLRKNLFLVKEQVGMFKASNNVLQIEPSVEPDDPVRQVIMAAVLCIDMVLKE